jgi:hypothetical protein
LSALRLWIGFASARLPSGIVSLADSTCDGVPSPGVKKDYYVQLVLKLQSHQPLTSHPPIGRALVASMVVSLTCNMYRWLLLT